MVSQLATTIPDLVLVEAKPHLDTRGFLAETFRADSHRSVGIDCDFVQENQSRSIGDTLRGIHFQTKPGQAKLVRCAQGAILDVAVDLRPSSPTYRQYEAFTLTDWNFRQLYIPIGFGHAFCVLSDWADVVYKLSSYYDPATEVGIAWDDPAVGIDWPITKPVLSERDREAPTLSQIASTLPWQ